MKKNTKIYVTKRIIENCELSELDIDLYDSFGFDCQCDNICACEFTKILTKAPDDDDDDWVIDTTPLEIVELIKLAKSMRQKGATHIQMAHHGDHHGYMFSGVSILPSTKDEILTHLSQEEEGLITKNKLKALYAEIDKIKNKVK